MIMIVLFSLFCGEAGYFYSFKIILYIFTHYVWICFLFLWYAFFVVLFRILILEWHETLHLESDITSLHWLSHCSSLPCRYSYDLALNQLCAKDYRRDNFDDFNAKSIVCNFDDFNAKSIVCQCWWMFWDSITKIHESYINLVSFFLSVN